MRAIILAAALAASPAAAASDNQFHKAAVIAVVSHFYCDVTIPQYNLGKLIVQSAMNDDITVNQASDRVVKSAIAIGEKIAAAGDVGPFCVRAASILRAGE